MKRIIIFSGTTEGRRLSELLSSYGMDVTVSVASEYGEEVMTQNSHIRVRVGRMEEQEIEDFVKGSDTIVIDATHPFARLVTENIRQACMQTGVRYIRLLRDKEDISGINAFARYFDTQEQCREYLRDLPGKILLTTGAKEVGLYASDESIRKRLIVRVLPVEESINLCLRAGLNKEQIIAAKGPFTIEENKKTMLNHNIDIMITKESGAGSGLLDKVKAAAECGVKVLIIRRPAEDGYCFDEVARVLFDEEKKT